MQRERLNRIREYLNLSLFIFGLFSEATDIELHKESKWYSGWKNFSESNTYYNS